MKAKERVVAALLNQKTDRVPWVPFVGCHAGALIGKTAREFLQSEEFMVEGIQAAIHRYHPDGIPVSFDLQIEAEALGCELVWADENPPSVAGHVLMQGVALKDLKPIDMNAARIPLVMRTARRLRAANPDVALYGLITGPFTLALHLLGTDIFMKMFDEPAEVQRLMDYCAGVGKAMAAGFLDAGCDIVAVVDPMTSQIGPDQFREFVLPYVTAIFDDIRERKGYGSFFVCGHAQQNIEAMCECRAHNISIDENIPLDYIRDICVPRGISFGGNLQLTSVLLLGTPEDAQMNALACMDIGSGSAGFILAPGCDLPYGVPPANIEAVTRMVTDPYEREVLKAKGTSKVAADLLDLSEYGASDKVIVDIITLDSEACAPCQYMVEAVRRVAPEFEGIVEWREHKIKQRESLVFMTSLMVRNVPTICIDGEITFVSRIPARDELIAALQKRINAKLRLMIQQRRATLYILGDGGEVCARLRSNAKRAIMELGADIEIVEVTDINRIHSYGIARSMLPAVVMARYQIKSTREVPEAAIIKEWIKDV
jgi:MtaA/CmuA family methyltransferase